VFFTHEIIDWTITSNRPLVLLKLNFTEAYDKVSWVFLFNTMERLGMLQELVNLVSVLIKDVKATMGVNGNITPYFHVHKGVRQGWPLAPYIFLIMGEILNMMFNGVMKIGKVRGIKMFNSKGQQTFLEYLDDTTIIVLGMKDNLHNVVGILNQFLEILGLKLDWEKNVAQKASQV
jgi:hypothetical protein